MNKEDIINELDELKLKIMVSDGVRSIADDYDDWADNHLLRGKRWEKRYEPIFNEKYAEYKTIQAIVDDLFCSKHGDKKEYHEHRPEIRKIIQDVVAMVMFVKDTKDINKCMGKYDH